MSKSRWAVAVVAFAGVFFVIGSGPVLRFRFGWSILAISAIQLTCGVLVLCLVGREAYAQATKGQAPASKPKLINIAGVSVMVVALGTAMLIARIPPR